ncbi:ATP-binding cassette domain-containing protein [Epibacterium sp. SM1979]|uniref:ATP-binding cassette domain-containing protein n=1 Tax=Tritonibacter litoralis TaxID=2662264 RepID=A0A843Y943_9RHOB|nr:ABC transporter ATP-binding protein [Tritonibacter litoralis]MQQ07531.1 ATP-binding cassette domain-containing protein [Tritonibacter litoralis]
MARVELRNLSKVWDSSVAVNGIDLSIADREFVAILGPSGCGKSTTLFMLAGVYMPTGGEIRFDDAVVNDVEARDRNVGIVFQSYALYPNMSVLQNIMFPLRFQKVDNPEAKARDMADLVQVGELLDRRPSQLSGGQQQRVALARALVKRPNLLLLDEPLSNLDATLRLTMRSEIRRITRELGVTTVLVTHDQLEATTMADRVICMRAGQIEQVGSAEDLYLRPETLFVASFIGSPPINLIAGEGRNGRVEAGDQRIETGQDGQLTIGIRPEMITVAETGLPGTIRVVEAMGREILYAAETNFGLIRFLEATSQPRWRDGDQVALAFQPEQTLLFGAEGKRIADHYAKLGVTTDA